MTDALRPPVSRSVKLIIGVVSFGLIVIGLVTWSEALRSLKTANKMPVAAMPQQSATAAPPGSISSARVTVEASNWSYGEKLDEMSGKQGKFATVTSSNTISLDFPYQGEQHGTLQIIRHPRAGNRVALDIERGQFLPVTLGGSLTARFDDGTPHRLRIREAADGDRTVIFIAEYQGFVASVRKATLLRLEAVFYQSGRRIFEFDVAGLRWK